MTTIVNSWSEFDPLQHIIIGKADFCCVPAPEPVDDFKLPEDSEMGGMYGPRPLHAVEAANAQLDNFAAILEARGITVSRPTPIQWNRATGTPDWSVETMTGCMPPRDILLTVGREICESNGAYRARWFEYLAYRPLLNEFYDSDPGFRWEAAPKSRLTDASFRDGYWSGDITLEQRQQWMRDTYFPITEEEPLFDAADVCRLGKDLFVQHGCTANLKGIDWLQRHFPDQRVHAVNFPGDLHPIHLDATFVPVRPGLVISNPTRQMPDGQKAIFRKNGWEIVLAAKPAHDTVPPLCVHSVWLGMNVLVLDHKTVCVEASEVYQMEMFDRLGFEVVPVPFRDVYAFGGGLHCSTADVYREGNCEDYFPMQVPGF